MSTKLGERIKKIRLDHGMTMERFGEELNTSKGTVNNWEKGRNKPNKENLKKIADLGDISVNELLYGYSLLGAVRDSFREKTDFIQDAIINRKIDLDSDSGFLNLWYEAKTYYENYNDIESAKFVQDMTDILSFLNKIVLVSQNEGLSKDEKSDLIEIYFKILNDSYAPLFNEIKEYFFANLDKD